jgi:hypothetical protein
MPTYPEFVTSNLIEARAGQRLSQASLAERMEALGYGWRQQTVTAVEGRRRGLDVGELLGLTFALKTPMSALLWPEGDDWDGSGNAPKSRWIMLPSGRIVNPAAINAPHSVTWDGSEPRFSRLGSYGLFVDPGAPLLEHGERSEDAPYEPAVAVWDVIFGDDEWHQVAVLGWSADPEGLRLCDISWRPEGEGESCGGFFVYDPDRMRKGQSSRGGPA